MGDDKVFSGEDAHFLYTSMGFPVDLTKLMAEEIDMTVDIEGFEKRIQEQKDLSAAAHQVKISGDSGKDMRLVAEQTLTLVNADVAATDDPAKYVTEELIGCKASALFIGRNCLLLKAILSQFLLYRRLTLSGFVKRVLVAWKKEEAAAKTVGVTDEVIAADEATAGEKIPTCTK